MELKNKARGQVGMEYMILIGFVTIAVTSILVLAFVYSDRISDRIRLNQVGNFGIQLINSVESTFFSGEPSKTTVRLYLPEGVESIVVDSSEDSIVFTVRTSSGNNVVAYGSRVPIQGVITNTPGIKELVLVATSTELQIG